MPLWLFAFLGTLAVVASLGVILQRNPVHCLLALALALTDVGALYIGLGAATVGFLQIIIYVGAILILFLFVIWMLNLQVESEPDGSLGLKLLGAIGAAGLAAELAFLLGSAQPRAAPTNLPAGYGSIVSLGRLLFSQYLIGFEVTSILLLTAIAGAVGLARRAPPAAIEPGAHPESAQPSDSMRSAAG